MIEALRKSGGFVSVAAHALGCDRKTVSRYIAEFPTVRAAYEETNEANLDIAEAKLMQQVRDGDPSQVRFYLRTKGRGRGYGDRMEMTGAGGGPIAIEKLQALSDDDLAAIIAGRLPSAT
jgi:hypothetical protein